MSRLNEAQLRCRRKRRRTHLFRRKKRRTTSVTFRFARNSIVHSGRRTAPISPTGEARDSIVSGDRLGDSCAAIKLDCRMLRIA
jgi:hypothetical protein